MKKTKFLIGITAIAAVIVFSFAACPNEPSDKAQTMTFSGSDDGGNYTLVITQAAANKAVFQIKENDTYVLTYEGGGSSKGKVTAVSGTDTFTLTPNESGKIPIIAKVSGTELKGLTPVDGTVIIWDGTGGQTTAPGTAIDPPKPTQPSTPSAGPIIVTDKQLYEYDYDSDTHIVYNGSGIVYAEYWSYNDGQWETLEPVEIGKVTNGKLSFKLQEAPPAEALYGVSDFMGEDQQGNKINPTVNPSSAKISDPAIIFVDDYYEEKFSLFNLHFHGEIGIFYVYANMNVIATASFANMDSLCLDWNLKTGWNTFYHTHNPDDSHDVYTSTKPTGADDCNWILEYVGW